MGKVIRFKVFGMIVILLMLITHVLTSWRTGEVESRPMGITDWLKNYDPWQGGARLYADRAMRRYGTNAVPVLRQILGDTTLKLDSIDSYHWHTRAFFACAALGTDARVLLPELSEHFFNLRYTELAADALAGIGDEGVRVLIDGLAHTNALIRRPAAESLGRARNSSAANAIPELVRLLNDTDASVRASAARTLASYPIGAPLAVPSLTKLLADDDNNVRAEAIYALGHYGRDSSVAVPYLIRIFRSDPDEHVRFLSRAYLYQIDRDAAIRGGVK